MRPENVTGETNQRVERFERARHAVTRIERDLTEAKANLEAARNELGKFLSPDDRKPGEHFCIWYGDGLLNVSVMSETSFEVSWRKRPSKSV
jgi:hypothetical protein